MPVWLLRAWTLVRAYLRSRPRAAADADVAADEDGVRIELRGTIRFEGPGEDD